MISIGRAILPVVMIALPTPAFSAISESDAQALREQITALTARLEMLEKQLATRAGTNPAPAQPASPPLATAKKAPETIIAWKGSPQFRSGNRLFKAKGRIQYDAGYVSKPPGSTDRGLGFSTEARRIRLGGEGNLGAGFGYKLELELSDNSVDLVDTFVTYEKENLLLTVGNQNQFQSLDEVIGDTSGSVMERAAFTDAFNFERRLGLSAQYQRGAWLAQAGLFADDIQALSNQSDGPAGGDENNSYSIDGRVVFAPKLGTTQIHIGASGHWRRLGRVTDNGVRYRQRPYLHSSNSRIIATPLLTVAEEFHYGVELAGVRGPWHFAGEAHWLTASRPGLPDPNFFGGYAEVGYYLTEGDSRSYADGMFGRSDPHRPLGDGGIGSIQVTARYDMLGLNDGVIVGGRQDAIIGSLIWTPITYLRFNLNYAYLAYSRLPGGTDDFGLHVGGMRVELDF